MLLKEIRTRVENSAQYKEYIKAHSQAFLAHLFVNERAAHRHFELAYFDPIEKKATSFVTEPTVRVSAADEKLMAKGALKSLAFEKVTVSYDQAMQSVARILREKYGNKSATSVIGTLQQREGPTWNLTVITSGLSVIVFRIAADTGKVLVHEEQNLMGLGEMLPGTRK